MDPESHIIIGGKCVPNPSRLKMPDVTTMPVPQIPKLWTEITPPLPGPKLPALIIPPVPTPGIMPPKVGPLAPIPSPEEAVVDMTTTGEPTTVAAKPAGRGGAIAVGAGAGFLVGNIPGAIIGAIVGAFLGGKTAPAPPPVAGFDGFSLKKLAKAVTHSTVGKIITAPLVAPTAIFVKGTTAALAATGIKPLRKLDIAAGKAYRGGVIGGLRRTYGVELATGAAVGATVLSGGAAAPMLLAAMPGATLLATGKAARASLAQTMGVGIAGAAAGLSTTMGGKLLSSLTGKTSESPPPASEQIIEASASTTGADMPVVVAPPPKSGIVPIAAGAGAGLLVLGPVGAIIGGIAGMLIGRKG